MVYCTPGHRFGIRLVRRDREDSSLLAGSGFEWRPVGLALLGLVGLAVGFGRLCGRVA